MQPMTFLLLLAGILGTAADDASLIREARARSNAAIAAHDIAGILAELDSTFHVTAGSGRFIDGRDAMGEAFESQFNAYSDVVYTRTIETVVVSISGSRAYESGVWVGTWTAEGAPLRTGGKYAASWSNASGTWKIRSELFVTLYCNGQSCP